MAGPVVRMLALDDVGESDLARWRRLCAVAIDPNLYLDPRYAIPLLTFGDHDEARLAVVELDDEWLAAAVFVPERVRLLKRTRTVLTTGSTLTDQLGRTHPLVDPRDPVAALAALMRGVASHSPSGIVHFDEYFADGPLGDALDSAIRAANARALKDARGIQPYANHGWPGPTEEHDVYGPAYASRGRRANMRRYARALSAQVGVALVFVDHGADRGAFDAFVRLQASGWKGDASRGGAAIALRAAERDAFTRAFEDCGADGTMFVGGIYAGDRPIHLSVFITDRQHLACVVIEAYDEQFRDFRAGSVGRLAALAHILNAYPALDLDPAIRRPTPDVSGIYPDRRPTAGLIVAAGRLSGRAVLGLASLARRVRGSGTSAATSQGSAS